MDDGPTICIITLRMDLKNIHEKLYRFLSIFHSTRIWAKPLSSLHSSFNLAVAARPVEYGYQFRRKPSNVSVCLDWIFDSRRWDGKTGERQNNRRIRILFSILILHQQSACYCIYSSSRPIWNNFWKSQAITPQGNSVSCLRFQVFHYTCLF